MPVVTSVSHDFKCVSTFHAAATMKMIPQRGFVELGVMAYAAIAAGVVILGLSVAVKVQTARLAATQQELATEQANRALWQKAAETCSKATDDALVDALKRIKSAQDALKQVRQGSVKAESEIARLRASKPSGAACPAAEAVGKVREGLKQ